MNGSSTPAGRAIGYVRVSTRRQEEKGMSLADQREAIHEYARDRKLALLDVVQEAASGGVLAGEEFSWEHRPVLLALMARAEAGEFDVLIVKKLDRLSRDHATLIVLERRLQRFGIEVLSATEKNGDGPVAELLRGQLALIAQFERAQIRERLQMGKIRKKAEGRHVHGRAPYGYRSREGVLTPDEQTMVVVKRIYTETRGGDSPAAIARRLERDAIPTPQGGSRWTDQSIRVILRNPVYSGERHGVKKAHPAIISRRSWNQAQETLNRRRRPRTKQAGRNAMSA